MADSIWWRDDPPPSGSQPGRPASDGVHDVAVVGAGLTGLTTALLLARAGLSVVVLEARHPGAVTTGRTTGKVSALQGTMFSSIARSGRRDVLPAYLQSTLAAQDWLAEHAGELDLEGDGGFERRPTATYAASPGQVSTVESEHRLARELGLPVTWSDAPDLPVPAVAATLLPDQWQLDAGRLVRGLTGAAVAAGADVVTGWRLRHVRQRGDVVHLSLRPGPGSGEPMEVRARHAVVATGAATLDRRLHFARLMAQRSYLLAYRVPQEPEVMALSAGKDSRSYRGAVVGDDRVLLAGGAGHETGRGPSEPSRVEALRAWVAEHWPGAEELAAWSAQDYAATDQLPLVGSLGGPTPNVQMATGFHKWGMTSGVAAALAMAGSILGRPEPWAEPLYGRRARRLRGAGSVAMFQAGVAAGGIGAVARRVRPAHQPPADARCGVVPVCTHLGGILRWNDHERSWDCPLHGSRFDAEGQVLEGPATRTLLRRGD